MEQQVENELVNESTQAMTSTTTQEKVVGSVNNLVEEQQCVEMEFETSSDLVVQGSPSEESKKVASDASATVTAPQVQPAPHVDSSPQASGLSLLAAYSSDDSDDEKVTPVQNGDNDVIEVPVTDPASSTTAYRPVVAVSSDDESSKSSSSSSDSDSDSEGEYLTHWPMQMIALGTV